MQIGEVIREYRKRKNMTQEEMANRLGVTAPAVNKWENGNSQPDIMLLAPIARLLNITLDTLLCYQEELTAKEINSIVSEIDTKLKDETYEEAFQWAKGKIEKYPNCEQLIWQMALILDAWRLAKKFQIQRNMKIISMIVMYVHWTVRMRTLGIEQLIRYLDFIRERNSTIRQRSI
jgi:transcriptional regulator with XRE-family HTH domain